MIEPVRDESCGEELFQTGPVDFPERLDLRYSFEKSVFSHPRMPDAGALSGLGRANKGEVAPGVIEVPGDEAKLIRARIQINVKVLAVTEQTVVAGRQRQPCE